MTSKEADALERILDQFQKETILVTPEALEDLKTVRKYLHYWRCLLVNPIKSMQAVLRKGENK